MFRTVWLLSACLLCLPFATLHAQNHEAIQFQLRSPLPEERLKGVNALAILPQVPLPLRQPVVACMCDQFNEIRGKAATTYKRTNSQAYPHVMTLVSTTKESELVNACLAIEKLGPTAMDAVPALVFVIERRSPMTRFPSVAVCRHAIAALRAIAPKDCSAAGAMLRVIREGQGGDNRTQPNVVDATYLLGIHGSESEVVLAEATPLFMKLLSESKHETVREAAIHCLGVLGVTAAREPLQKCRFDESTRVRDAAEEALVRIAAAEAKRQQNP